MALGGIACVFFSCFPYLLAVPVCRRFVCGGSDMWVRLHDYETGQELDVCKGELRAAATAACLCCIGVCASLRGPQKLHVCTHACLCGTNDSLPGWVVRQGIASGLGGTPAAPVFQLPPFLACAASS